MGLGQGGAFQAESKERDVQRTTDYSFQRTQGCAEKVGRGGERQERKTAAAGMPAWSLGSTETKRTLTFLVRRTV